MSRPTEALNFKRIGTPSYRTYRVLQARGDWGQLYRSRVAEYGDFKGAIIFPEQLFSLNQSTIYAAGSSEAPRQSNGAGSLTLSIQPLNHIGLYDGINGQFLTRSEQVLEYEDANYTKDGIRLLTIGTPAANMLTAHTPVFGHMQALFTSKDQACRWLEKQATKQIRKLVP